MSRRRKSAVRLSNRGDGFQSVSLNKGKCSELTTPVNGGKCSSAGFLNFFFRLSKKVVGADAKRLCETRKKSSARERFRFLDSGDIDRISAGRAGQPSTTPFAAQPLHVERDELPGLIVGQHLHTRSIVNKLPSSRIRHGGR